jgi:sugar (pentulose or hexulose) kinase
LHRLFKRHNGFKTLYDGAYAPPFNAQRRRDLSQKTILAVDCGTQSLRALLFSDGGDLLAHAKREYEPYFSTRPGWAEQDPEIYWQSLCEACAQLKQNEPRRFDSIAGVGVTTQRNSMINVDRNGKSLRPAILWLDQRKAAPAFAAKGPLKWGLKLLGLDSVAAGLQAEGKCNWLRQNQPRLWDETFKYLQVSGFLNHRLTGRFADSVASQIGHIPFHYKKMRWATPCELIHRLFPIEREKLPDIVRPGEVLGSITAEAAQSTGIEAGIPVVACGSDKGCETVGAGVIDPGTVSLSFGTTATVQTTSPRYFEPIRFLPPYPAPIPDRYNPEVEIFRGYWMISWFKKEFAHPELLEAKKRGIAVEELLNRHLCNTPPGAMGLLVQPYWGPGLGHPSAKGAMIGFGDVHTKAHLYRAIIEGLGFALYDGLQRMQRAGGFSAKKATVSGGASQSDDICKITADIFNLPMVKSQTHETAGLGAAMVAAVGIGCYATVDEAVQNMMKVQQVFEPSAENVVLYQDLYQKVYRRIYRALSPLYSRIKQITGYPE